MACRQGRPSLNAVNFSIRGISRLGMARLKQVTFTLTGHGGGSVVVGVRVIIHSASYRVVPDLGENRFILSCDILYV